MKDLNNFKFNFRDIEKSEDTFEINKAKVLFNKGVQAEKANDLDLALEIYRSALKTYPKLREAYINLGNLLSKKGRLNLALASFKRAYKLKKDFIILFNLGVFFYKIHRFKSASYMFYESLKLKKDFIRAYILLGFSYSQTGKIDLAEQSYRNVLSIEPGHPQAIFALTYLYLNCKKYFEAFTYVKILKKIDPQSKEIDKLYTKISFLQENPGENLDEQKLLSDLKEIIKGESRFKEYNEFIIECQKTEPEKFHILNLEITEKIEKLKNELTDKNSVSSQNLLDLSLCYLFQGKANQAIHTLGKARLTLT